MSGVGGKVEESDVSHALAEKDLAHIRAVLIHLEHRNDRISDDGTNGGISLDYWRSRIGAVLAIPLLPASLQKQSRALLERLDRLNGEQRRYVASP